VRPGSRTHSLKGGASHLLAVGTQTYGTPRPRPTRYVALMARSADKYRRGVARGLTRTYETAAESERTVDVADLRLVVFSDHHKGARDGADDFLRCEAAYRAALAHYLELGHTLFVLGDVEELWECHPQEVLAAYPDTLGLERRFHEAGRYERFWGNHDDDWRAPSAVERGLAKLIPGVVVREALRMRLTSAGQPAGLLFFVHGHQGTGSSDRWGWLSRIVVRQVWRRLQRRFGFSATTPARSFELRAHHDRSMFAWAAEHPDRPILVAGHTHRPVFWTTQPPEPPVTAGELAHRLDELRARQPADPAELARLHAELEQARAQEARRAAEGAPTPVDPPCYFNTGCCSFPDGDVTGVEVADGLIRLVRWPDDEGKPRPKVLAQRTLEEVLGAVRGASR
jgi:hypothetical protein